MWPIVLKWVGERFLHVVIYGAIILGVGFFLYSAFLKPTTTQNTNVSEGGKVVYVNKDAKINGWCVNFEAEKHMKDIKK